MPWSSNTFDAVCAGLRQSAAAGEFVPYRWIESYQQDSSGGQRAFGCGWGLVGYVAAIMMGGANWARHMLPVGCGQKKVDQILMFAGLTAEEIELMESRKTWEHFDRELSGAYENRHQDWNAFIVASMRMAEFFISVLERVPVEETAEVYLPPFRNFRYRLTSPVGKLLQKIAA